MTAEMEAYKARLDTWRAKGEAEQRAWFEAQAPESHRAALARVVACPHRGPVLSISLQPQDCARCGELSECRAGRGDRVAGRVTLRECLECQAPPTG